MSVKHIEATDLESFKKQVELYAKDHPNADIKASGFMISTKPKKKSKTYKYDGGC